MRRAIGRLFDSLGIMIAAVLTLCGFLLLLLPWKQALSVRIVDSPKPASGEVVVNLGTDKPK
jgi:hypothetical protein